VRSWHTIVRVAHDNHFACGVALSPAIRPEVENVVQVAIAREMVGFIWSIACTIQSAPRTA
jgi:hypothetical protein